jgi:hypothetical protein
MSGFCPYIDGRYSQKWRVGSISNLKIVFQRRLPTLLLHTGGELRGAAPSVLSPSDLR